MNALATWSMLAAIVIYFAWLYYEMEHAAPEPPRIPEQRPATRELTDAELEVAVHALYVAEQEALSRATLEHLAFVERTGWRRS